MVYELKELYRAFTGVHATQVEELPSSGSNRRYFRLRGGTGMIGVSGESAAENAAFIYLSGHLRERLLPVPAVYAFTGDYRFYLQEDLGDVTLFDAIAEGRQSGEFGKTERRLLRKTIALLPSLQISGAEGLDFSRCHPEPDFNRRTVIWDLNYFKYCFLKAACPGFCESRLEDDFGRMCEILLSDSQDTAFLYRDFQSRNVMVKDGEPWFIDFQGGRRGPVFYDVASFLWQARAGFTEELRRELLAVYLKALGRCRKVDERYFRLRLRHFVLFRTLQVLGAYGFRGYFERKPHFIQSIPFAIGNLRQLLREGFPEYPYLCSVLGELTGLPQFSAAAPHMPGGRLEVRIVSFAYKNGIPDDPSGHGGGFVFDCRAVSNPGRYESYSRLTGLDEPVSRFLKGDGGIDAFLEHAFALADASVQRYLNRGFSHLTICFGCTGGQHRSVYSAQRMAEHLHGRFGVKIHLIHREQHIEQIYDAVP
jgi:aminoglycoside/choline kinase family phosphotransferase